MGEGIHPGDVYWSLQEGLQLHKGLGLLRGGKVKVATSQSITIHPIEQIGVQKLLESIQSQTVGKERCNYEQGTNWDILE